MLKIENLSKTYPPATGALKILMKTASDVPVEALRDVSFEVEPGQVVGLIGPNGAGKTTIFRIVATLLEPTSGRVVIDGRDIGRDPSWATHRLGLVLEGERGVYTRLTGIQNLEFFGIMQGMTKAGARARAEVLMDRLGILGPDKRVFGYSAGMRVRLALARSMLADPPLLLLDEPTRSLDPMGSLDAMSIVTESAQQGRAVLLATHRLDEIRAFCDQVVVMSGGRVRYWGPPSGADLVEMMSSEDGQ